MVTGYKFLLCFSVSWLFVLELSALGSAFIEISN